MKLINPIQCQECDALLPPEARFCLSCGARIEPGAAASTVDPLFEALNKAIGFQYRIERLLGRGGMGSVYLAHEFALDRDVAIKVLPPEHAETPGMRERFRREARTAARLSHPNIVPLHTFGEVSGLVYFVMGYVAGESLASRLRREGPLPPEDARMLLAAIADALDYAHRQGIVHRDIKPDNILIESVSGVALLTDFGIAKPALSEATQLTSTGQLIGTPHYMSPEQARGADVDARSDLYSLGVVAYEIVSGRRPFDSGNLMETLTQRLTSAPKPLSTVAPELPPDLAGAVDRCLQIDVTRRWPDARSLREALLPSDEDSEDSFPGRILRASVIVASLSALASEYLFIYSLLNPDARHPLRGGLGVFVGGALTALIFAVIAAIGLRREGLNGRSILRKAFVQPSWWRSWYPASFRRRGDVWNRLPYELRRFRVCRGLMQIYALSILLPLQLLASISRHEWAVRGVSWAIALPLMAFVLMERRRASKFVRENSAATAAEASAILTMPTWRASAWRKAPTLTLLTNQKQMLRTHHTSPPEGPTHL